MQFSKWWQIPLSLLGCTHLLVKDEIPTCSPLLTGTCLRILGIKNLCNK